MPRTLTKSEAFAVRALLSESGYHTELSAWAYRMLTDIEVGARFVPAVRHPLGFVCVHLYRGADWGLCLHIWESADIPIGLTTTPIHAHSWDLDSQVVCGWLENIEIRVTEGGQPPTHRVMAIISAGGTDLIQPTRRVVSWTRARSVRIGAGDTYRLLAGTFHVSNPSPVGITATVLLAQYRSGLPELALGRPDSREHLVARQACPPSQLRVLASATLRQLAATMADAVLCPPLSPEVVS